MATFAARLRTAREAVKLSQSKLALEAGVHQQEVSEIELEKRSPSERFIAAVAPVLGLDVAVLRAWALEDELGADEARKVARALLDPETRRIVERIEEGGAMSPDLRDILKIALTEDQRAQVRDLAFKAGVETYRIALDKAEMQGYDATTQSASAASETAVMVAFAVAEQLALNLEELVAKLAEGFINRLPDAGPGESRLNPADEPRKQ